MVQSSGVPSHRSPFASAPATRCRVVPLPCGVAPTPRPPPTNFSCRVNLHPRPPSPPLSDSPNPLVDGHLSPSPQSASHRYSVSGKARESLGSIVPPASQRLLLFLGRHGRPVVEWVLRRVAEFPRRRQDAAAMRLPCRRAVCSRILRWELVWGGAEWGRSVPPHRRGDG